MITEQGRLTNHDGACFPLGDQRRAAAAHPATSHCRHLPAPPLQSLPTACRCGTIALHGILPSFAKKVLFYGACQLTKDREGRLILFGLGAYVATCQALAYWRRRSSDAEGVGENWGTGGQVIWNQHSPDHLLGWLLLAAPASSAAFPPCCVEGELPT